MSIGSRIAEARLGKGYSVQTFAEAVGVSPVTVYSWERQKDPKRPEGKNWGKIVELTGKPEWWFYMEADMNNQPTAANEVTSVPDHKGVRLLAADAEVCRQHRVIPEELHLLAELVILRDGQPVIMESLEQALRGLDFLRSVPAPP